MSSDRQCFGTFAFDPSSCELWREGRRRRLRPQVAKTLHLLLTHAGEVVAHEDLAAALWPDSHVRVDQSLHSCIRQLRRALGDDAAEPRFVETLPRIGYRFIAAVKDEEDEASEQGEPSTKPPTLESRRWFLGLAVALTLVLATVAFWLRPWSADPAPTPHSPAADSAVGDLLSKAEYLIERGSLEDRAAAADFYRRALETAPDNADAWAGLARMDFDLGRFAEARASGAKALELDPGHGEGHLVLGALALFRDHDWSAAQEHYDAAVAAAPENPRYRWHRGFLHAIQGRNDEAIADARAALELDPVSPLVNGDLGLFFFWAGRNEEAARQCEHTLELVPESIFARLCALAAHRASGEPQKALAQARWLMTEHGASADDLARLDTADPDAALTAFDRWWLTTCRDAWPRGAIGRSTLVFALLATAHTDEALDQLEQAYDAHEPLSLTLAADPRFAPLQGSPRFQALRDHLGL